MIVMARCGTTFITADAFYDRYLHAKAGTAFSYATGDLAGICQWKAEASELRALIWRMEQEKKVRLTQRRRPDLVMAGGGAAFEYLATRCAEGPA